MLVTSMHAAQTVKENKLYEARTAYKYAIQYIWYLIRRTLENAYDSKKNLFFFNLAQLLFIVHIVSSKLDPQLTGRCKAYDLVIC